MSGYEMGVPAEMQEMQEVPDALTPIPEPMSELSPATHRRPPHADRRVATNDASFVPASAALSRSAGQHLPAAPNS